VTAPPADQNDDIAARYLSLHRVKLYRPAGVVPPLEPPANADISEFRAVLGAILTIATEPNVRSRICVLRRDIAAATSP
jgi:hypothetical protein